MSQFIHEHPWAFFWLCVITLLILDNCVVNLTDAMKTKAISQMEKKL